MDHWEGVGVEEESVGRDEEGRSDKFAEGPFYNATEENGTNQAYSVHLTYTHNAICPMVKGASHTCVTLQHVDWPVPVHTRGHSPSCTEQDRQGSAAVPLSLTARTHITSLTALFQRREDSIVQQES